MAKITPSQGWPFTRGDILEPACQFLRLCALHHWKVLIVPDKDADGLCAGAILQRTILAVSHSGSREVDVLVHPVSKGQHVHQDAVRAIIQGYDPQALIVTDLGSREGAIIKGLPTLLIDHHKPEGFPDGAVVLSGYGHCPVPTSSLLSYLLCCQFHPPIREDLGWLAAMGTVGDLGVEGLTTFPEVPELMGAGKKYGKVNMTEAVSLINAARRVSHCDVTTAWRVVATATCPADIARGQVEGVQQLRAYRRQVQDEVSRCARVPPRFNAEGSVALLRIRSGAQVHPLVATRWMGRLKQQDKKGRLLGVICANDGYIPDRVNFSIRRPGESVDLIQFLKQKVENSGIPGLKDDLGEDFARGHAEATGGSVPCQVFDRLLSALGFTEDSLAGKRRRTEQEAGSCGADKGQKKLTSFFKGANA